MAQKCFSMITTYSIFGPLPYLANKCYKTYVARTYDTFKSTVSECFQIITSNIGASTPAAPPALSRFFPSLTHLISLSFLQLQQRLRPFLETLGHVDSEYTLEIDF